MKILFIQETDWLERNPVQQHHLAEMLSLRGHEIRVIDYEFLWKTKGKKELYSRRETFNNVYKIYQDARITVIRPGIIKIPVLNYVSLLFTHKKEIDRQIKEFTPDVIVSFGILNSCLAQRAARKNNIPFLYYWIDVLHLLIPFKPFQFIGKNVESRTLKRADRILTINDILRDYVIGLGAPPERSGMVKTGINLEQFKQIDDCNVRKEYNIKEDDIVLFFMGWLYNFSGLKESALELAKTENPRIKLLIVGEGDAYDELKKIQDKYNLQDKMILTGKKPYQEIPSHIAAADICLLPAYPHEKIMQDIVPVKLYEYLAMSKPVISTKLPGVMKEFGEDNGVVYIDKPEDVLNKSIELTNNGHIKDLGSKARKFVERYSWDTITDEFEGVITEVISS